MSGYLVDLHVHSAESSYCGHVPAHEIVSAYREAGFDGIAITDHYGGYFFDKIKELPWPEQVDRFMRGYEEAKTAAEGTGFKVYFGIEYRDRITVDDFLVFGLDRQFLLDNPDLHDIPLKEAAERIHAYGGFIIQAHPARIRYAMALGQKLFMDFRTVDMVEHMKTGETLPEVDWAERNTLIGKPSQLTSLRMCYLREPDSLDGVEVYNGNPTWAMDGYAAEKYADEHPEYVRIAASDFHSYPCGMGGTYFDHLPENDAALVRALQEKRIVDFHIGHDVHVAPVKGK